MKKENSNMIFKNYWIQMPSPQLAEHLMFCYKEDSKENKLLTNIKTGRFNDNVFIIKKN